MRQHGCRATAPAAGQQHTARARVLDGVAEQVAHDALDQHRVAVGAQAARRGADAHRQPQPLLGSLLREFVGQPVQHRLQLERPALHLQRAGIHARDVQQRVEHRVQRRRGVAHPLDQLGLRVAQRLAAQCRQVQAQRVGRLAQVVAGRGKEAALGAVGRFGRVLGGAHLVHGLQQLRALAGHAALELGVEQAQFARGGDEAVDQDPGHQRKEQQPGKAAQEHRVVVRQVLVEQPIAHAEKQRHRAGGQQQRAVHVALAQRVATHGRHADRHRADPRQAPVVLRGVQYAGELSRIQQHRAGDHADPQRTLEARQIPLRQADAEDHQRRDEERETHGPPDAQVRRAQHRVGQHRPHRVQRPEQTADAEVGVQRVAGAAAPTAAARTATAP